METTRIVDALEAFARRTITVADRVQVHVRIAVARLTNTRRSVNSFRIAVVAVDTFLAQRSYKNENLLTELPKSEGRFQSTTTE